MKHLNKGCEIVSKLASHYRCVNYVKYEVHEAYVYHDVELLGSLLLLCSSTPC